MSRIFITGSSDGIGAVSAGKLIAGGHRVVLHARNAQRAEDAVKACPGAEAVLTGDLSRISDTRALAQKVNELGPFDAIVHNAGIGLGQSYTTTEDGLASTFHVNSLAPYILTCLINKPKRLVYVSSSLHNSGDASLKDITWEARGSKGFGGYQAYCDTKLQNGLLALAVARKWKDVKSNFVDPGWVPTKLGGQGAPEDIDLAGDNIAWLAAGEGKATQVSGRYFKSRTERKPKTAVDDTSKQDHLMSEYARISGIELPL